MASQGYQPSEQHFDGENFHIAIVVAEWNKEITAKLLSGALDTLSQYGCSVSEDDIVWVPGSFELPAGAKIIASVEKYDAIICLGCIIKGETNHDEFIAQSVANGLTQLSLISNIPCLYGVLTTLDEKQAIERSGGIHGNKGSEAALSALQMAALKRKKRRLDKKIGY